MSELLIAIALLCQVNVGKDAGSTARMQLECQ